MTRAVVMPFVAPGLSALARQMVAEIGEEDQERREHAFLVAVRTEPVWLPLWQYVAGIDWHPAVQLLRGAGRVLALVALVLLGVPAVGVTVSAAFGAVPAVAATWFAAGVAVALLVAHVAGVPGRKR